MACERLLMFILHGIAKIHFHSGGESLKVQTCFNSDLEENSKKIFKFFSVKI